jgi:hypothetical protein
MTHVAPIPDKPPFMYGLTAFQTALSDILLCVIVERARFVTTGCAPRSIKRSKIFRGGAPPKL